MENIPVKNMREPGTRAASNPNSQKSAQIDVLHTITDRPLPILTLAVLVITFIGAVFQSIYPSLLGDLWRDPQALTHGQWWRLISPMFVEDGNLWWHFIYVALGFVLVGFVAERKLGRPRWLLLFFISALIGELVGSFWQPHGAGTSIALCGLIGGLSVWQISHNEQNIIASIYTVGLVVALTSEAITSALIANQMIGIIIVAASCWLASTILLFLRKRTSNPRSSAYYVLIVASLGALILAALHDIHGISLLVGLCAAIPLCWQPLFRHRASTL